MTHASDIKLNDARPYAFLIATAYPEIWNRFTAACEEEAKHNELDPRLLEPKALELKLAV